MKAVLAEQPNPAPQTPTAPAQFPIATVVFALPPAPQTRSAQVTSPIAAPAHVSNVLLIPNAQIHHIARTKLASLPLPGQ